MDTSAPQRRSTDRAGRRDGGPLAVEGFNYNQSNHFFSLFTFHSSLGEAVMISYLRTIDNRPYGSFNIYEIVSFVRRLVATSIARHKTKIPKPQHAVWRISLCDLSQSVVHCVARLVYCAADSVCDIVNALTDIVADLVSS